MTFLAATAYASMAWSEADTTSGYLRTYSFGFGAVPWVHFKFLCAQACTSTAVPCIQVVIPWCGAPTNSMPEPISG